MARKNNKKAVPAAQKPPEEQPKVPEPAPLPVPAIVPTTATVPQELPPPKPTQSNQPPAPSKSVPAKHKSHMAPSNRARLLWGTFENWAKEKDATLQSELQKLASDMETLWRGTPAQHRDTKDGLNKRKAERRREKQEAFYEEMRNEWDKRLDTAGLKMEDWDDLTEAEGTRVMKILGGDDDLADETISIEDATSTTNTTNVLPAPLSMGSRSTNISADYDFVRSFSLHSEPADDPNSDTFDFTSFNDDTNSETSANPWSWESEASGYNTVATETPQSSSHSSPKLSSDTDLADFVSVPGSWPQFDAFARPPERKRHQSRYVGPELHDTEEPADEADFQTFKMEMRILKIREFHSEAANAEIDLARRVAQTRLTEDIHALLSGHEERMLGLQERKEIERKALVEAERQKRKKAIRERSTATATAAHRVVNHQPPRPNLFGETDLGGLAQQVIEHLDSRDSKPVRKKKPAAAPIPAIKVVEPTSAPSQDTVRQKVSPFVAEAMKHGRDYNPYEYDLNHIASNISDSMAPPIGTSFSLPAEPASTSTSRPISTSRTHSTSHVTGREFWVPPSQTSVKQAVPSTVKPKAAVHNPPANNPAPTPSATRPSIQHARSTPSFFPTGDWQVDVVDTEGASSSKTMLEDMRRPESRSYWVPPGMSKASSTASTASTTSQNRHEIWLPPQQATAPTPRASTLTTAGATRRVADPVPDSKQIKPPQSTSSNKLEPMKNGSQITNGKKQNQSESSSTLALSATASQSNAMLDSSGKKVTIEDVPDEAEEDPFEHLPSDSKHILEPRPVVAPAIFDQILQYEEEPANTTSKALAGVASWDKVMEDKAARAKHVRWTPSVVGGSPASAVVELEPKSQSKKADKKGKGKVMETGDDLSRKALEALAGLKKFGGKA